MVAVWHFQGLDACGPQIYVVEEAQCLILKMKLFLVSLERKQSLATAGPQSCLKWGVAAFFRRCTAVPQLHWIPYILHYLPGPRGTFNLQSCSRFLATGASPFLWHQIFCLYCCWVYASCGFVTWWRKMYDFAIYSAGHMWTSFTSPPTPQLQIRGVSNGYNLHPMEWLWSSV